MKLYHGTFVKDASAIMRAGFKIGPLIHGDGLGRGLYLSGTAQFASEWGEIVIVCRLAPGTRILWHKEADPKVIAYLKREFGAEVTEPDFWKALPRNKRLKRTELAAVWNHLLTERYIATNRWKKRRMADLWLDYPRLYQLLKASWFHAVGFREGEWPELLVFNPSLVQPVSAHRWDSRSHRLMPTALDGD